ncbi:MAG TPA: hypothetical protein DCG49_08980 [Ruminococcus sp.]|nr:hypothetical protein [Ruminococcus sp.]
MSENPNFNPEGDPKPKKNAKNKIDPANQKKQIAMMVGAVVLCAGLVTWTALLLKDRLQVNDANEQTSNVDIMEMSEYDGETAETTTATRVVAQPWSEEDITTAAAESTSTGVTSSTSATHATAPATLVTQPAHFVRVTTTTARPAATAAPQTNAPAATHTEAQQPQPTQTQAPPQETQPQTPTAVSPPTGAQIPYNQLLAMYLSAQNSGCSAYFADALGSAQPVVVLSGTHGMYAISPAADVNHRYLLGGTGSDLPHPTGQPFRLSHFDGNARSLYYTSEGNNAKIIGYFDNTTCNSVWANLYYTQSGAEWQTEYVINRTAADGSVSALASGGATAYELYGSAEAFEQVFARELSAAGFQTGNPAEYPELHANDAADSSVLWSKAGSYNSGFSLQGSGVYGVVSTTSDSANLRAGSTIASNIVAVIPAGSFLCVDRSGTVNGWVPVSAMVNGTWHSGYMSSELLMTWNEP